MSNHNFNSGRTQAEIEFVRERLANESLGINGRKNRNTFLNNCKSESVWLFTDPNGESVKAKRLIDNGDGTFTVKIVHGPWPLESYSNQTYGWDEVQNFR